jgi:hypothetical protein
MNMIFADHHGFEDIEFSPVIIVVVLALAGIVLLVVILRILRGSARNESTKNHQEGPPRSLTPDEAANAGQSHIPAGGKGEQKIHTGIFSDILEMLAQKGCPIEQSEIAKNAGLMEEDVAVAIADLEQSGLVRRTWDRERAAYMVESL